MATIQAKSVRRREDFRLLTGQGNYAADAAPAGMAVAIFLRSPYAHARIEHIDAGPARDVGGRHRCLYGRRPDGCRPHPRRHRLSASRRRPRSEDRPATAGRRPRTLRWRTGGAGHRRNPSRGPGGRRGHRRRICRNARRHRTRRSAAGRRARRLGRCAGQYRLPVEARRCGRNRTRRWRIRARDDAGFHCLPRDRQLDGAARRLGVHRRRRTDRTACVAPVPIRAAQRHGEREFSHRTRRISAWCPAMSAAPSG